MSAATPAHADLLLKGGRVHTMDDSRPQVEAVAVAGDRLLTTGTDSEVLAYRGPQTTVVDLAGRTVLPGFYDAHQHQVQRGLARQQVDGRAGSITELIARVRARAGQLPAGRWIEGSGYDDGRLEERRHPDRHDLDRAAPEHPTLITRTCGHVIAANSLALKAAGITADTPDPAGGRIDRDPATREPTGVLREKAMERLRRVVPQPSKAALTSAILEAARANLSAGVTSVWEPGIEPNQVAAYADLEADGRLPLRVTAAHKRILRDGTAVPLPRPGRGAWLSTAGVKIFQDGAIAPRTAALSEPYVDEPDNRGLLIMPQAELDELVREVHLAGLQACIHAIGDAAIDSALMAIERASAASPAQDPRHRIEHCGLPLPHLQPRLERLGPVAVLQPAFIHFYGDVYSRNLGPERSRWLYPARTLLGLCRIAGSSDGPVVPDCRPLLGIRAAMTRRTLSGATIAPEEALSFPEALRMFTLGAAIAAREEADKGSLVPGKLADLVVLEADPARVAPEELDQVPIEMVIVGGRLVVGA